MNIRKNLNIISGVFFVTIILLSAWSLVDTVSREIGSHIAGIVIVLIFGAVSAVLSGMADRLQVRTDYRKTAMIFCCMASGLLIMQILFVLCQDFSTRNDLSYVCQGAENLVTGRPLYENIPEVHKHYFAVYPNNHALFMVIYGLYRTEYFLTGNITNVLPVAVNIISLNLSYVLMYMTAKKIYTPEKALMCAVRGMMFTPLVTYAAFFYTDSMTMPWITGALYLYIKCRADNTGKNTLHMLLCGMVLAVAYKLKGSAGIFVPAIIVDMILNRRKNSLMNFSVFMTAFVICCVVISGISGSILAISDAEMERYRFPLVHWVMMSADGRGGYCADDFRYTLSFCGYKNKVNADIARLSTKLSRQGISGFIGHIIHKISYTWRDCTYMAGYYNGYSFLKSYGFYIFTGLCHFTMMSGIVRRCFSDRNDNTFVLRIMFTGLAVFLIIWEARCRYLVSFFALFALL